MVIFNSYVKLPEGIGYWKKIVSDKTHKLPTTSSPRPTRRTASVLSAPPPVSHRHQRLVRGSSTTWTRPAVDPMGLGLVPENDGKKHETPLTFDGWSRLIKVDHGHLGVALDKPLYHSMWMWKCCKAHPHQKKSILLVKYCAIFLELTVM